MRLAPYRGDIAREEALRKSIRQHYDKHLPLNSFEAQGAKFGVVVGPKSFQRSVDKVKLIGRIGLEAFSKIASVTFSALTDYCIAVEEPGLFLACSTPRVPTGPRDLTVFPRGKRS